MVRVLLWSLWWPPVNAVAVCSAGRTLLPPPVLLTFFDKLLKHGQTPVSHRILRTNQIWLLSYEGMQSPLDENRIHSASILFKIIGRTCCNSRNPWSMRKDIFQPSRAIQFGETIALHPSQSAGTSLWVFIFFALHKLHGSPECSFLSSLVAL